MQNEYELLENILINKERYEKMVNNTNIYKLRTRAAEQGIEMTIDEVKHYLNFILDLCRDS